MEMKSYKVTCLNCDGSNIVKVTEVRTNEYQLDFNEDHFKNPDNIRIISGRYRPDMQFGWECICRNTSIVCREEFKDIKKLVPMGGKAEIERLTKSLATKDNKKFSMSEL